MKISRPYQESIADVKYTTVLGYKMPVGKSTVIATHISDDAIKNILPEDWRRYLGHFTLSFFSNYVHEASYEVKLIKSELNEVEIKYLYFLS